MLEGEAFGAEMVDIVRSYVDRVCSPLREEIKALREIVESRAPEKGEQGEPGRDGADVDMAEVERLVVAAVEGLTALLPKPVVGKDGQDGKDGPEGSPGAPGADGRDGLDGKDGIGLANAMIDREGSLVLTMTDGSVKSLGCVIGRDGADGSDGQKGLDGLSAEDVDLEMLEDGRTILFSLTQGGVKHSFEVSFPVVLYQGVYSPGRKYKEGDSVTWGGSLWIAQKETEVKPDGPDSGWRLAVKKGRDGKDGVSKS